MTMVQLLTIVRKIRENPGLSYNDMYDNPGFSRYAKSVCYTQAFKTMAPLAGTVTNV